MKYRLFLLAGLAACHAAAQSMPNMTTLAITRSTTALAALYSVHINNNLVALYETAEPLARQQAVRVTAAPSSTLSVVFNGTAELDCRWQD